MNTKKLHPRMKVGGKLAEPYKTTRIWARTLKDLRTLAALKEQSLVQTLDRIVVRELQHVKNQESARAARLAEEKETGDGSK